jgi:hypothetical protein
VKFSDGTRNDCINPSLAVSQRTYPIRAESPDSRQQTFEGVISKRMDFEIHIKGLSIRDNGQRVPFKKIKAYRYEGKKTGAKTILEEWADV